uniref:translation initiation factor 1 n=1 Tax=Juncus grisebachii TaxID=2919638 RepID=UPI001F131A32|nr:translation initiation factor 1 [Juncus grisebachii]ULQ66905.1 translation initiation factor 1 [Juncus grisebachii]
MKKKRNFNQNDFGKDNRRGKPKRPLYEGKVVDPIKDILFHVKLDHNNDIILGYLSGNLRRHRIRVLSGDKVLVEIVDPSSKKGRIVSRLPRKPMPNLETSMEPLKDDEQVKEPSESSKDTENKNKISSNSIQPPDQEEEEKKGGDTKHKNSNQDLTD